MSLHGLRRRGGQEDGYRPLIEAAVPGIWYQARALQGLGHVPVCFKRTGAGRVKIMTLDGEHWQNLEQDDLGLLLNLVPITHGGALLVADDQRILDLMDARRAA